MPVIIMSGVPSCGKSRRALQLKKYFEDEKNIKTFIINEDDFLSNFTPPKTKDEAYNDSKAEKIIRSGIKSEVVRLVNKDDVIIVDGLNYIKGYRYELYCASKQHGCLQCTIECVTPTTEAWEWNLQRESQYSKDTFDALVMRYEAPDSRNRWDSPLFSILPTADLPLTDIYEALFLKKAPKPNQSTQLLPLSSNNFLHELDNKTQEVVSHILNMQKTMSAGDIKIPGATDCLSLDRKVTLAELSRHRRQFITYTKSHPVEDSNKIIALFVQYLNTTMIR